MRRLKIAIDCDDVLADNAAGFVEFSNKMWGTRLTPEDYDEHWAVVWGVDNDEVEKRATELHNSAVFRDYRPVDAALPSLQRLADQHELCIVTSRRQQVRFDTQAWLHEHYTGIFTDATIHFAGIWDTVDASSILKDKSSIVESIGADVLIDGQIKHCAAVAQHGRGAILSGNYTWNQAGDLPRGVVRCVDWSAVEKEVERIAAT